MACGVISVSPRNADSVAMSRKLGFARFGNHMDEQDGYEEIPSKDWKPMAGHPGRS
jgi:hypothetical protein